MPLGVPWSKRMRIGHRSCVYRHRRRVETAGGEFEHGLNLFSRYMKLLDDFFMARARLKIFKHGSDGHSGAAKYPRATAPFRHAFDGGALGPIKSCHVLALLPHYALRPSGNWTSSVSYTHLTLPT